MWTHNSPPDPGAPLEAVIDEVTAFPNDPVEIERDGTVIAILVDPAYHNELLAALRELGT